jgi:hypothetical protein
MAKEPGHLANGKIKSPYLGHDHQVCQPTAYSAYLLLPEANLKNQMLIFNLNNFEKVVIYTIISEQHARAAILYRKNSDKGGNQWGTWWEKTFFANWDGSSTEWK